MKKYILVTTSFLIPFLAHIYSRFFAQGYTDWLVIMCVLTIVSVAFYRMIEKNKLEKANMIFLILSVIIIAWLHLPLNGFTLSKFQYKYILTGLIIAPVLEELAFRIIPLNIAKKRLPVIILGNLLFAVYHFSFPFTETLGIKGMQHFLFGIAMSVIYVRFQKVRYPMIIHATCNLWGMFLL